MVKSLPVILLLVISSYIHAQPDLDIRPGKIEFEDRFSRFVKVWFLNEGNQPLEIDSISYLNQRYFIRWDSYNGYPMTLPAGDTLGMDCILSHYASIAVTDTVDTMFVYVNYRPDPVTVKIKIKFHDPDPPLGTASGSVVYQGMPVPGQPVYMFHEGLYQYASAVTDIYGNFSLQLPAGEYRIAAKHPEGNLIFSGNTGNPFAAQPVVVKRDSVSQTEIVLPAVTPTGFSVQGVVSDSVSVYPVDKGVVVIRKGKHNPGKILEETDNVYAALVDYRGNYTVRNINSAGYYFVQSFSDYFIPAYYKSGNYSPLLWQDADSIYVNSAVQDISLSMQRDSAYGDGRITGSVQAMANRISADAVVLYARSPQNAKIYATGISGTGNGFLLPKLPYGTYELLAQSIHLPDYLIGSLEITPAQTSITGVTINLTDAEESMPPAEYALLSNYPNPFNPATTVRVELSRDTDLLLKVFDASGSEVMSIYAGFLLSGIHEFKTSFSGLSSGMYFVRMQGKGISKTAKLLLMK
ncbi:MAG: T9SS type A sorting domain-containing protein [Ignavibacteriales bacterium]|nr:MAG: T9SS type A sorting domain-containing protein [Ignavibacteriales bacterium]